LDINSLSKVFTPYIRSIIKDQLLLLKHESLSDVNFVYSWLQRQKKLGDKWAGTAKVLFKIKNCILIFQIESNKIIGVDYTNSTEVITSYDVSTIKALFSMWEIHYDMYPSRSSPDIAFGIKGNDYLFAPEFELDIVICYLTKSESKVAQLFLNGKYEDTNRQLVYRISNTDYRFRTILKDITFDASIVNEYFYTVDNSLKNILIRNLFEGVASNVDIDILEMMTNVNKKDFYKAFIYKKLDRKDYKLENLLRNYCNEVKMEYNPVSRIIFSEFMDKDYDISSLPDNVYESFEKYYQGKLIDEKLYDILEDFNNVHNTDSELDWSGFLSKWGDEGVNFDLILRNRILLPQVLKDPRSACITFNDLCIKSLDNILEFLGKNLNKGLSNYLTRDDVGFFRQNKLLTESDIKSLLYFNTVLESEYLEGVNMLNGIFEKLIEGVFFIDYIFKDFKKLCSSDPLLSKLPLTEDFFVYWKRIINGFCYTNINYRVKSIKDLIDREKQARYTDTKLKSLIRVNMKYKPNFLFNNYNKPIDLNLYTKDTICQIHLVPKELNASSITIPICFLNNVPTLDDKIFSPDLEDEDDELYDILYDLRMDYDGTNDTREDCLDHFEKLVEKGCMKNSKFSKYTNINKIKINPINQNNENIKEFMKYKEKYDNKPISDIKIIDVKIDTYYIMNDFNIDNIACQSSSFVAFSPIIPLDLKLQPKDRLRIYHNRYCNIKGVSLMFVYNVPNYISFNRMGFTEIDFNMICSEQFSYMNTGKYKCEKDNYIPKDFDDNFDMLNNMKSNIDDDSIKVLKENWLEGEDYDNLITGQSVKNLILSDRSKVNIRKNSFNFFKTIAIHMASDLSTFKGEKLDDFTISKIREKLELLSLMYPTLNIPDFIKDIKEGSIHINILEYILYTHRVKETLGELITGGLVDMSKVEKAIKNVDFKKEIKNKRINLSGIRNKYSPIAKDTMLYNELKAIFSEEVETILNRGLILDKFNKNKLYNTFTGFLINLKLKFEKGSSQYKSSVLFIQFILKVIKTAKETGEIGLQNRCARSIEDLYKNLWDKVDNLEGVKDDYEIEYLDIEENDILMGFMSKG
jgi:hypothetical protein